MGLVDGASRNGPDSFWREWWAQTMWPEVPGAGGWASVRGKPPFLCVAFYGQVSHFGGPPAQRKLMRRGRRTAGRWMLGTEISLGSPILSQFVPFAVPVSYGSGRAGRKFRNAVPLCPTGLLALGCGGRWGLRAFESEQMFVIGIGLCYVVRRGLARGGCQSCKPILGTHRVGVGPAKGRAYNGRILNYDFIENSAPRVHLFW